MNLILARVTAGHLARSILLCAWAGATLAAPLAAPALNPGENIRRENGEVTVNGGAVSVIRYTWRDAGGDPRSVSLLPVVAGTPGSGYAVQMTYQVNDAGKRTVFVDADGAADGGFGYFVSHELFRHFSDGTDGTIASLHGEDDSPYGRANVSTGTAQSTGTQQAVHEYRLSYSRWGTVAAIADPDPGVSTVDIDPATHKHFDLPVVIRWTFVAGQDYPLWSVDYDLSAATDHIATDVRAPYGVMHFNEGNGFDVTALRWGDWYHFVADANGGDFSAAAQPQAGLSWDWTATNNGRRYNVLGSGAYEFGIVSVATARNSTPSYADGYSPSRTLTKAQAGGCPGAFLQAMPCPYEWAYQSFQYDAGPPARPKIGWGTSPFLGTTLAGAWNGVESEPMQGTGHISYGVHLVMGRAGAGTPLTLARAAAVESNRNLTVTASAGGAVTYTVLGDVGGPYSTGTRLLAPWSSVRLVATPLGGSTFTGWTGACAGETSTACMIAMDADNTVGATFSAGGVTALSLSPPSLDFGPLSMGTTSPPLTVTVTNPNGSAINVNGVAIAGPFTQANDCGMLAGGASCTVTVRFTPVGNPAAGLNSATAVGGTLSVSSSASAGPQTVGLAGVSEKSLVRHYYRAILNRTPDDPGFAFWQGEATRLAGLGADINEAWFVMAGYFFNSAEYAAAGKNDAAFVTDLYNTFFNRAPDGPGLTYWTDQIGGGLPRDVVLFSFMFSTEFRTFAQGIFGNTAARPEVNVVMDLYRGILNRLPDTDSFHYWLGRLRAAQCASAGAVYTEVDSMSVGFIFSGEYNQRARNNTQYVTDMYYSFLRRGGDAGGVSYWIGQLDGNVRTKDNVRANFIASPEFGARVQAVINAGCAP